MRFIHFDVSSKESYSLDSVGKHGFGKIFILTTNRTWGGRKGWIICDACLLKNTFSVAMEIGPQPHGVVRSNIYTAMKDGVQHMLDWVRLFNSGKFEHKLPMEWAHFDK